MSKKTEFFKLGQIQIKTQEITQSIVALILALIVSGIIILLSGYNPIIAYISLFEGAFGSLYSIAATLSRATPIIFTGLAMTFAFLVNATNLGAEGQLYMGAFFAFLAGYLIQLPAIFHIILSLLIGALGGVLWSILPTVLKVKRGVHEIVTTMMMNGIAILLTDYLTLHHFLDPTASLSGATDFIHDSSVLIRIPGTSLSMAFIVALITAIIAYYLLKRTSLGYKIRAVGLNPKAAKYAGISVSKIWSLGMIISGAFAGLGGAGVTLGFYRRFLVRFSPGYGLPDGIVVALIGRKNPIGVILAGILVGALYTGSINMRLATSIPKELVFVIMGIITIFMAIPELWRLIKKWRTQSS